MHLDLRQSIFREFRELQWVEYKALLSALLHVRLKTTINGENVRLPILRFKKKAQKMLSQAAHYSNYILGKKTCI